MTSGKFQSSAPSFSRSVVMSCKDWCEGSGWHFTPWINESNQLLWMTLFNCFQGKYFGNILLYSFLFSVTRNGPDTSLRLDPNTKRLNRCLDFGEYFNHIPMNESFVMWMRDGACQLHLQPVWPEIKSECIREDQEALSRVSLCIRQVPPNS